MLLAVGLALAGVGLVGLPPAELVLPGGRVPDVSTETPVVGPWRLIAVQDGVRAYEAPIPVRPRSLFFSSPPAGMDLKRGRKRLRYTSALTDADQPGTWAFTTDAVVVRVAADEPRPDGDDYVLSWAQAAQRERTLHPPVDADPRWVFRSAQVHDVSRDGVYLPAPATIAWNVDVPAGANLRFSVGILPPEAQDGTTSDGAFVDVTVDGRVARTVRVRPGPFQDVTVPLGGDARTARVGFVTRDGAPLRDHVFIGAPAIFEPKADPERVILVFIDTLRRDHLGTYGYARPTPAIDALAAQGTVFEDARTIAPWTLPSTRAVLSGRQPEEWPSQEESPEGAEVLPRVLAAAGWATAAWVGNVYLSSNFEMAAGWGEHGCVNWPSAAYEVRRTLDFLERHPDQDALVMVHFMDLHLPYKEPLSYRRLYSSGEPEGIPSFFTRNVILRHVKGRQEELRRYLIDRYDQNLRFVDDQLGRLFRAVGDDATIVLFADHGEEFFDHGDLEHGHTFYDELLRVPLIVRAPGAAPRRVDVPASLLDITPTVLDLLGFPVDRYAGYSLAKLVRGEPDPRFSNRPRAFGRPLYGKLGWGSVLGTAKYVARDGAEHLYDLAADPMERVDRNAEGTDLGAARQALADALGSPVVTALRLTPSNRPPGVATEVHVPGGILEAWVGDHPNERAAAKLQRVDDETLRVTFTGSTSVQREVYVLPRRPMDEVLEQISLKPARPDAEPTFLSRRPYTGDAAPLGRMTAGGRSVVVTWATTPLPMGRNISAFDEEMAATLEAIGYLDPDR